MGLPVPAANPKWALPSKSDIGLLRPCFQHHLHLPNRISGEFINRRGCIGFYFDREMGGGTAVLDFVVPPGFHCHFWHICRVAMKHDGFFGFGKNDADSQFAMFVVQRNNSLPACAHKFVFIAQKGNAAPADGCNDVKRAGIFAERAEKLTPAFSRLPVPEK